MNERVCEWCGAAFIPRNSQQLYCSERCYKAAHKKADRLRQRERRKLEAQATARAYLPDVGGRLASLDELMRATKRPRNCSPIRWRMELRRRANAEYYKCMGVAL